MNRFDAWRRPKSLLLATLLAAVACGPTDDPEASPDPADRAIPTATRQAVVDLGSEAARELGAKLVTRLQAKLAEEGPVGAVEFCSVEGLPLTSEVSREVGFDVKRTSSRIRNPANAPDSLERSALEHFEAAVATGDSLPAAFVQHTPAGDYRHYQPLRVQPFCLQCHGTGQELADGVAEVLAERYPDDRATGYAAGEFRGLIRVTVPEAAVRAEEAASPDS